MANRASICHSMMPPAGFDPAVAALKGSREPPLFPRFALGRVHFGCIRRLGEVHRRRPEVALVVERMVDEEGLCLLDVAAPAEPAHVDPSR